MSSTSQPPPPHSIKTLTITGGAAEDFQKGGIRRPRSRRHRKDSPQNHVMTRVSDAGENMPNTLVRENTEPTVTDSPVKNIVTPPKVVSSITYNPVKLHTGGNPIKNNIPPQPPQQAGASTKLVLAPPKRRETRLVMKGPKGIPAKTMSVTKKTTSHRKITLGLRGLTARIHKAKKIHKNVEDMKKDEVKKLLVEKGIIKGTKKDPPEALMRQMYADYLLLTTKGL